MTGVTLDQFKYVAGDAKVQMPLEVFVQSFAPALKKDFIGPPSKQDISDAITKVVQTINYLPKYNAINDPLVRIAQAINDSPANSADVALRPEDIENLQKHLPAMNMVGLLLLGKPLQGSKLWYTDAHGEPTLMDARDATSIRESAIILLDCHSNMLKLPLFGDSFETAEPEHLTL